MILPFTTFFPNRFEPIVIPAGATKGIYITINETSTNDNLIGLEPKISSQCAADWSPPFQFPILVENADLSITEGVYKDLDWQLSYGSSNEGKLKSLYLMCITHPLDDNA